VVGVGAVVLVYRPNPPIPKPKTPIPNPHK